MRKKWLSVLLSICMAVSALVIAVGTENTYAAETDGEQFIVEEISRSETNEQWHYVSEDGTDEVEITGYTGSETKLVIPSEIDGKRVTSIGDYAFDGCSSLTSITIPTSVTSIEEAAFRGCSSLTSITIPESVTRIEDSVFSSCSSLTSITIPESVTSIGGSAFSGCSSLTSVTIPEGVTRIEWFAFYNCSSLTSITIPESVTSIEMGTFFGCSGLTSITIPESVTSIEMEAFRDCSSLTSVSIPEGINDIDSYVFFGCSNLTSVVILEGVTHIWSDAFAGCSNLKTVIYAGTEEKWKSIKIDSNNEPLTSASIYYNSIGTETKPSETPGTETGTTPEQPVKVNHIKITAESTKIAAGKKLTLKAEVLPDNAKNKLVEWSSSNTKYATVNAKGVVTAKTAGIGKTVTITATAADGSNAKGTYKLQIKKALVTKISLQVKNKSVKVGKKVTIKAKVSTSGKGADTKLKWTTSNKKYASVTQKGVVTAKKAGKGKTVTITATAADGSGKKASVKLKIK